MKAINGEQKALKAELSAVTEEFKGQEGTAAALSAKHKLLQETFDNNTKKVAALEAQLKEANKAYPEGGAQVTKYTRELGKAKAQLEKSKAALQDNTAQLRQFGPVSTKASQALHNIVNSVDDIYMAARSKFPKAAAAADAFAGALNTAGRVAKKGIELGGTAIKKGSEVIVKGLGTLTAAGAAGAVALGTLAVSGFKQLTDYAVEAAKNGDPAFAGLAANLTQLEESSNAAKAALGKVLLPALEELSSKGADLLKNFTAEMEATNGDTAAMGEVIAKYIREAVSLAREELPEFLKLGGELISGLGEGLIEDLPEILNDAEIIISQLLDGLESHADQIGDTAAVLIKELAGFIVKSAPSLLVVGLELILSLVEGILDAIPDLVEAVPELIEEFKTAFEENGPRIAEIGHRIVDGIWEGLKAAWNKVTGWISGAIGALGGNASVNLSANGSHAGGLSYVPFDGYRAILHEGEQVLTRREAQERREGGSEGGSRTVNATINIMELTDVQRARLFKEFNEWLGGQL